MAVCALIIHSGLGLTFTLAGASGNPPRSDFDFLVLYDPLGKTIKSAPSAGPL